jgi:hypothetical protein
MNPPLISVVGKARLFLCDLAAGKIPEGAAGEVKDLEK